MIVSADPATLWAGFTQPASTGDEATGFAALLAEMTALRAVVAEPFNADGFFAASGGIAPAPTPTSQVLVEEASASVDHIATVHSDRRATVHIGGVAELPVARVEAVWVRPDILRATPVRAMRVTTTPTAPSATRAPVETARAPSARSPVARPALPKLPAAASPVAIAVQEVAGGLNIVARIAGLDEAERSRIADAIATLLAHHGLSAANILVTTASAGAGPGRNSR